MIVTTSDTHPESENPGGIRLGSRGPLSGGPHPYPDREPMDHAIDAVLEIFTWVGIGAGILLALVTLVVKLADGTWLPTRAVVEHGTDSTIVRWFDEDGGVNAAMLHHDQEKAVAGRDMTDIFYRRGHLNRMRLTHGSPAVRAFALLAAGLLALGLVAMVTSWVLLFVRG